MEIFYLFSRKSPGDEMYEITDKQIDFQSYYQKIVEKDSGNVGAVVSFVGIVRGRNRGRNVRGISYECYRELAENYLKDLEEEILKKYRLRDIVIAHRTGMVYVGEISLIVICASEHRDEAFKACREVVERIKEKLPIWKKEIYENGEEWI